VKVFADVSARQQRRRITTFETSVAIITGLDPVSAFSAWFLKRAKPEQRERFFAEIVDSEGVESKLFDAVQRTSAFTAEELGRIKDDKKLTCAQLLGFAELRPELFPKNLVNKIREAHKRCNKAAVEVSAEAALPGVEGATYSKVDVLRLVREAAEEEVEEEGKVKVRMLMKEVVLVPVAPASRSVARLCSTQFSSSSSESDRAKAARC